MKEALTEAEAELAGAVAEEWIARALGRLTVIDEELVVPGVNFVYSLAGLSPPEIAICGDPADLLVQARARGAKGMGEGATFDPVGLGFDAGWTAFYDYFRRTGVPMEDLNFDKWLVFLESGVWASLFYENVAFVCSGPKSVRTDENGALHAGDGKAIEWRNGWGLYALNGVVVDEDIVMTPARDLDPQRILTTQNAEVRREIIRKIGIERAILGLKAKTIDAWDGYELLELPPIEGMTIKAVYLKMRNPSTGTYHVEGVPPEIRTCRGALSWRIGGAEWKPDQLT